MRTLDFWLRETGQNLRRHLLIAFAASGTMLVALLLVGSSALVLRNIEHWAAQAAAQAQVSVFVTWGSSRAQSQALRDRLAALPHVRRAVLITKEAAFRQLRRRLGDPAFDDLPNPLTDSIRIWTREPGDLDRVARAARSLPGVRKVVHDSRTVGVLTMIKHIVILASGGGIIFLLLAAAFIIHNTIRLALHARRREIEIMTLVGATPAFVAGPFVLEGAFHGLLGALLASLLLAGGYLYLLSVWHRFVPFLPLLPGMLLVDVAAALVLVGLALGVTASALSLRRYLKRHPAH